MKTAYRATIGRITARFNWDGSGVFLAILLFLGELMAVILAVISVASRNSDPVQLAALLGALVVKGRRENVPRGRVDRRVWAVENRTTRRLS